MAGCSEADLVDKLVRGARRLLLRDLELTRATEDKVAELKEKAKVRRKARESHTKALYARRGSTVTLPAKAPPKL
eukprot:659942-Prymnesium_polylepis.1